MLITGDMADFLRLLKKNKVRHVLVGGFSVIYYGYVRTTQDIDILVLPNPENADKMLKVLKQFGFGGAGFTSDMFEKEGTAIHLGTEPNRIDILTSLKGVSNASIFSNRKKVRYQGVSLDLISFKDLIKCKKHSGRLKDRADAEVLEKTLKKRSRKRFRP
jgi:predicted nucleotidyltransferase